MIKTPIGIIDMGIDNISILNYLSNAFKFERFIYINDLEVPEYEYIPEENILKRVEANVEVLIKNNAKLIVVVSNTIMEYCRDYFEEVPIPVVNIVDSIIDYVNKNYEHRNMAFIATENIMTANIYQKNFKYNHLYNLVSDNLEKFLHTNRVKTSESFKLARELLRTVLKKDLNLIIPTSINMMLIKTEISEYLPNVNFLDLNELLEGKIRAGLLAIENFENRKKGSIEVVVNVDKKNVNFDNLLKVKYKLISSFVPVKQKKLNN